MSRRATLGVLACLALAGCAGTPPAWLASGEAREITGLLEQFDNLAGAGAEEQRRELAAAQAAFERSPSELNRLRLALVLSLPHVPQRDDARIIALLDEPAAGPPTLRREVAVLVQRMAAERLRLLREEQRRGERLEAALREEQKKTEELQKKLGALRAIDRDLRRRP